MKKVYQYLLLAGLVVLAAACENEIAIDNGVEGSEQQMITETISANILGETKATVDASAKFAWTVGDNIAVHVSNGKYVYTSGEGGASKAEASASFTVSYPVGYERDAFAIFPSTIVAKDAANYGQSEHSLDVTLPASYALDEVSGTATPCPMIATNTPGFGWTFSQLCGLLRLTLNNLPPSTKSVTIDFNGKKVQGSFAIAAPVTQTAQIETSDTEGTDDIITINTPNITAWTDNCVVNIPVPVGTYTNLTVKSWTGDNGTGTPTLTMTRPMKVKTGAAAGPDTWTATRGHGLKVTASLPAFSVSDTKRVHIAKSNLKLHRSEAERGKSWEASWTAGECTWQFMENAWSILGIAEVSVDNIDEIDVCHPCWGSSGYNFNSGIEEEVNYIYGKYYKPWETIAGNHTDYGPKGATSLIGGFVYGDWGVYACHLQEKLDDGYGEFSTWRLLTSEEALFLYGMTANDTDATEESDTRYSKRLHNWGFGRVNGVGGIIFVPDYFVDPTGIFYKTNAKVWPGGYDSGRNVFDSETWPLMEAAGAAFFPKAGLRLTSNDGHQRTINTSGAGIDYWTSSSSHETNGHVMRFWPSGAGWYVVVSTAMSRKAGANIRLVRDLN